MAPWAVFLFVSATAAQEISDQEISDQEISAQEISAQEISAQEINEIDRQGLERAVQAVVTITVRKDTSAGIAESLGDEVSDETRDIVREVDKSLKESDIPRNVTGSGIIVSSLGWVATAAHLVEHAERITVEKPGGKKQRARLIGMDEVSDVALLRINETDLAAISMVPSACPGIAQSVYAIGAPFGFSGSVTSGIISAVDRKVDGRKGVLLLQNDAAVNPGNSGGALVNPSGELLGIISQVYTGSSGYAGISFALPTSELRRSLLNILQRKKLKANWTGVSVRGQRALYPVGVPACAQGNTREGLTVRRVRDNTRTRMLHIAEGDTVHSVNGLAITTADEWDWLLNIVPPGGQAEIEWLRDGNISSGALVRPDTAGQ